ncbi:MAG: helicase-related protein [Candidatus Methanoperedens sp.]|nr:helicase-related protein [Candidatus Methanoperedens sp.]
MPLTLYDVEKKISENSFDDLIKLKLNVDAFRLHLKHKFDPVSAVAIGKIDPLPHQIEAFVKMMRLLRPQSGIDGRIRMLLADDVGLGKTIMIGLVMKELILRKKIHRVLIVSPSGLQIQWKEEMNDKFNESFKIIHGQIESNLYIEENRAIISVDTGRSDEKLELLLQASWDMIIIDEAHKLKPGSLRFELAQELSKRTKHLILASATPHDGKVENFTALVKLVDDELEYNSDSGEFKKFLEPLMIRRLKEEIVDFRGKKIFPKRDLPQTVNIDYSPEEMEFYNGVEDYVTTYYQKADEAGKNTAILALYILHRRVSSSIKAGLNSLQKRKIRLLEPYIDLDANKEINYLDCLDDQNEVKKEKAEEILLGATASTGEDLKVELKALDELIAMGEKLVAEGKDSKFKKLIELVRDLRKEQPNDKIIIFTEFTDTLRFLENKLIKDEGFLVSKITGGMSIEEKKEAARIFESSSHILLGTEAAGEGLNLQFANIAVNYELPWNPNRLEQRIGRVYRYGQKKRVFIHNFKTAFPIDDAVLKKIHEKMENIRAVFGDSAIDVIGSLISEKEMLEIFKVARTAGSGVDKVEEILSEKLEIFKEIDHFLIKERFNLIDVKGMTRDVSHCINNFDIERFFLSYITQKKSAEYAFKDGQYIFDLPKVEPIKPLCIDLKQSTFTNYQFKGVFDTKSKGIYVALGHPALEAAIEDSLGYSSISLISSKEKGILVTFILKFFNGLGQEIYSEPLLLLKNDKESNILDPLMIWEMNENKAPLITKENIEENKQILGEILENPKSLIENKIKDIEQFVQEKNSKDLKMENDFLFAEYDWKIKNQNNKKQEHLSKGQNYLISGIDKKISELRSEIKKLLEDNQRSETIRWELCGPVNVAFLIPSIDVNEASQKENENIEELKKEIELKGMRAVMEYEEEHGREPKDVSFETIRGYDIESKSTGEKRCIEVKSFATQNPIQITSNEWRAASQIQDEYYLYVVQNVFSKSDIHIIRNPYENLIKFMKKVIIEDYRMVLDKLPENFDYAE